MASDGLGRVVDLLHSGDLQWTYAYELFGTIRTVEKNSPPAPTPLVR